MCEVFSAPIVYTVIDQQGIPTGETIVIQVPWDSDEWDKEGHFISEDEI